MAFQESLQGIPDPSEQMRIQQTSLPIDETNRLILDMGSKWQLPLENGQKTGVNYIQKWVRLCEGYIKSCELLDLLEREGAITPNLEAMACRRYLNQVYRSNNFESTEATTIIAANRAFKALIGGEQESKVLLPEDPSCARILVVRCATHKMLHPNSPVSQIFS